MTRLRFVAIPEDWAAARSVLDEVLRDHHSALDHTWSWAERAHVVRLRIDTATLPIAFDSPIKPACVQLLSASVLDSTDGATVSGGSVTWTWRRGRVVASAFSGLAAATRYDALIALTR